MSLEGKRGTLADYSGERVACRGFYEAQSFVGLPHIKTACMRNIEVSTSDGNLIVVNHTWVQNANAITAESPRKGDDVRFTALVHAYDSRIESEDGPAKYVKAYGLCRAEDVEVVGKEPSENIVAYRRDGPPIPLIPVPVASKPLSAAGVFRKVKGMTASADPNTLRKLLPQINELMATVNECGGVAVVLEMLDEMDGPD